MSKSELGDIVRAGIKIQQDLSVARLAQTQQQQKAKEDATASLAQEQSRRETQHMADVAKELAERWTMLEKFHPDERLAEVNNIPGISWGGTADITKGDPYSVNGVAFTLGYKYSRFFVQSEADSPISETVLGRFHTFITIGVGRPESLREYTGQYYHGGYGLFVREQDVSLSPIAPADTFKDLMPKTLRRDLSNSYTPHIVVIDVDHPQASDMLTELLVRSSIRRFGPRMGGKPIEDSPKLPPPVQANKGFWSRIFG